MSLLKNHLFTLGLIGCAALLHAADSEPVFNWQHTASELPGWMADGVIYEVNLRQYSAAGTFAAFEADLDRVAALGVRTLWLMPIHPIGEVNRKGTLGSYYAVKDFFDVNPEFGDKAAFRSLVEAAHARGMRVILDWVANHSAWDNPLTETDPHLYMKDDAGSFIPPLGTDWTDVIQFDTEHPGVRDLHIRAMTYWVEEFAVDGFRCDYAKGLPVEVWEEINAALLSVNPELFLLAESEQGEMQLAAFHATYGWELMHIFDAIAQGRAPATAIDGVLAARSLVLPKGAREMLMTSNHDENTWLGTDLERFGGGHQAFAVLTMTMDGIPLIYNGQEAGLDKRLEFFEKDPIDWRPSPMADFYRELVRLRSQHPALHVGAPTTRVATTDDARIYAFKRTAADGSEVLVICNLTAKDVEFHLGGEGIAGEWKDLFSGETVELEATTQMELRSWKYHVLSR